MDPATAMLIATAVATAAKGAGDIASNKQAEKAEKLRSKETRRETKAGLLNDTLNRGADLEAHRLSTRKKQGKRSAQSLQDTAELVRGAINI